MAGPPPVGPSTSAPVVPALKPAAITPTMFQRMTQEFRIRRNNEVRDMCNDMLNEVLDSVESSTDSFLRADRDNPFYSTDQFMADMAKQFLCLQSAAFASRNVAGNEATTAFVIVNKRKPPELKVKKSKQGKKDKKENILTSAKVDRVQKEKSTPAAIKTPQRQPSVDENNDTPVAINKGKRRAAAVAVAAVSANSVAEKAVEKSEKSEKRIRKESSVKKRTSNRLSKTPRVNTKEEDEPTYCFCSRVSFGEMIGCDNEKCEIEWFHFECIGLTTKPKGKWFCPNCRHPDSARMPKSAKSAKKEKD